MIVIQNYSSPHMCFSKFISWSEDKMKKKNFVKNKTRVRMENLSIRILPAKIS